MYVAHLRRLVLSLLLIAAFAAPAHASQDQPLSGLTRFFQQFGHDLKKGAEALGDDVDQLITGSTTKTVTVLVSTAQRNRKLASA